MSQFTIKVSGNPVNISLVLNAMDVINANSMYPNTCLDGYHFEDATLTVNLDERNVMTLLSVVKSNIRGRQ